MIMHVYTFFIHYTALTFIYMHVHHKKYLLCDNMDKNMPTFRMNTECEFNKPHATHH